MRILLVKLSSLGDVVHTMPVVHDILAAHPDARIDWIVEPSFAPLVRRVSGIGEVIECPLRRWSRAWWSPASWREVAALRRAMGGRHYDAILDLQGLTKSAVVARLAAGPRWGFAEATEGSSHEAPARWLVDHALRIEPRRIHAVDRGRQLAARALGLATDGTPPVYGLQARAGSAVADAPPQLVFVHGTSRDDKLWPHDHWVALGKRVLAAGWRIALPHGNEAEHTRAEMVAAALQFELTPQVEVWPSMPLDRLVDRIAQARGVIGVDSGLSHVAVALGLAHVQVYRFPTSWRTGPQPSHGHGHQLSVEAGGCPSVDSVWQAWQQVAPIASAVSPTAMGYRQAPPESRSGSGRAR
jgi:heptosyltransferase-1